MTRYRIHLFGADGNYTDGKYARCRSDVETLAVADMMANPGQTVQVWAGARLLIRTTLSD